MRTIERVLYCPCGALHAHLVVPSSLTNVEAVAQFLAARSSVHRCPKCDGQVQLVPPSGEKVG